MLQSWYSSTCLCVFVSITFFNHKDFPKNPLHLLFFHSFNSHKGQILNSNFSLKNWDTCG